MKQFIWHNTHPVTDEYHDGGGLLIVAEDLEKARQAWRDEVEGGQSYTPIKPTATDKDPDHAWTVEADPTVLVFPDSGCC